MSYIIAETISDALSALYKTGGKGLIVAGGTDLMIDLEEGRKKAETLIDISKIKELHDIYEEGNELIVGAGVTLTEIANSPLVQKHFPSLAEGVRTVGSLQIRNIATLTGNVLTAQPAADGAMALGPLNSTFVVESLEGTYHTTLAALYAGFGKCVLDSSQEIVKNIRIPFLEEGQAASFKRLEHRKALALPMLNVAANVKVVEGKVADIRITMGPVGVGPFRATVAEKWFVGKEFNMKNIDEASKICLEDANPRSNPLRGSKEYRIHTLPVMIKRALVDIAEQLEIDLSTSEESE